MNKSTKILVPLIIAISVSAGIIIGNLLTRNSNTGIINIGLGEGSKISSVINLIEQGYVDSVNVHDIVEKTIPEILKNLDPHTSYIPASDMQEVQEEMTGKFSGIGVQFSIMEDTVRVVEVISGGPSSKVGILPGDGL